MANLPNIDFADISAKEIDDISSKLGFDLTHIVNPKNNQKHQLKTNQIRNIYAHINVLRTKFRMAKSERDVSEKNKIYNNVKRELILLKPKLAYAKGRQPIEVEPFQKFMFDLIDKTTNSSKIDEALENFFVMVESVVAYHKYHGGN